jgi:hypothetical protein
MQTGLHGALCGGASKDESDLRHQGAAQMTQIELRRKLRAFPTGGLLFRLITR